MKPRVVYALIASVWIIAAVLLLLIRIVLGPPYLVRELGLFIPPSGILGAIFYIFIASGCISYINYWHQCILVPQYH